MSTEITPRDRAYFDIFVTAIEGGINYWAEVGEYIWTDDSGHEDPIGFHATIFEREEDGDSGWQVNRETIAKGVDKFIKWARDYPAGCSGRYRRDAAADLRYGYWDELDFDAEIADEIVQFGIFGELIYG